MTLPFSRSLAWFGALTAATNMATPQVSMASSNQVPDGEGTVSPVWRSRHELHQDATARIATPPSTVAYGRDQRNTLGCGLVYWDNAIASSVSPIAVPSRARVTKDQTGTVISSAK